jgi:tetratricopeptide (TPR) repeat protein
VLAAAEDRAGDSSRTNEWRAVALSAYRLRIVLLAQQGKVREAEALISQVANAGTDPLLRLLEGLTTATEQVNAATRRDIGEIQLQTALALNRQRDQLSAAERHQLDRCLAKSYLLTERSREAFELYESLLEQAPDDRELRLEYAESLTRCGTPDCLRRALPHWRYLENREKQGTTAWLRMRAEVIRSLLATGKSAEAEKLLSVTQLLYPELGGASLKEEYADLKRQIGRKN